MNTISHTNNDIRTNYTLDFQILVWCLNWTIILVSILDSVVPILDNVVPDLEHPVGPLFGQFGPYFWPLSPIPELELVTISDRLFLVVHNLIPRIRWLGGH